MNTNSHKFLQNLSWMHFTSCDHVFFLNLLFFLQQLHSVHQCLLRTHRSAVHRLQVKEGGKEKLEGGRGGGGWGREWVRDGSTLYFSLKLGMGFKGGEGGSGLSHFSFMKFMIKCLEGVSPGLTSVVFLTNKANTCVDLSVCRVL